MKRRDFIRTSLAGAAAVSLGGSNLFKISSAWGEDQSGPEPSRVFVGPAQNLAAALDRAIETLDLLKFIKPGDKVLVKPAVNSAEPYPFTASPEIVELTVRRIRDFGAGKVYVADNPNFLLSSARCLKETGISEAARRAGAEVKTIDEFVEVHPEGALGWEGRIKIARLATEVDHLVSLPRLSTHFLADFTISLKNWVGFLPQGERFRMHLPNGFKARIAELNLVFKPAAIVVDARRAVVSMGPDVGKQKEAGLLLAGRDPVAVDAVGLAVLKTLGTVNRIQDHPVWKLPVLARAAELGIGARGPGEIQLVSPETDSKILSDFLQLKKDSVR